MGGALELGATDLTLLLLLLDDKSRRIITIFNN